MCYDRIDREREGRRAREEAARQERVRALLEQPASDISADYPAISDVSEELEPLDPTRV